ncbi:hypothetical protein D3C81_1522950 [compost metagenome]
MQRITFEVADDPTVQVDLVQVPTAVVEVIEIALVGKGQGLQVAQLVVAVLQQASAVGFAQQLPYGIVGVFKLLFFTLIIGERDGQQIVGGVVAVVGGAILGTLAEQAADGITLEIMANRSGPCRWGVVR